MNEKIKLKNNFNLIRLIAAAQVLIVHSCNHFGYDSVVIKALKCFPGVPLFFFISGYLIGGTFIKNQHKGLKVFFRNRVLRLYPALIICTFISIVVVGITGYFSTVDFSISQFIFWVLGQISFYQFYNPEFMRGYGTGVLNGALWTIAVEIQFYLLTPIIFYLFKKQKLLVFVLFALSIGLNVYIRIDSNWANLYIKLLTVSFLPWIYMFLIGYFVSYYEKIKEHLKSINIFLILVVYIVSMVFIGNYKDNAMNSINPISAFLLCALVFKFSQIQLSLPNKVTKFIDDYDISYGIYIYHMPIINTLLFLNLFSFSINIMLTITLSIVLALISWLTVERRMMHLKR